MWQKGIVAVGQYADVERRIDEGLAQGSVGVGCVPGYMTVGRSQQELIISQVVGLDRDNSCTWAMAR